MAPLIRITLAVAVLTLATTATAQLGGAHWEDPAEAAVKLEGIGDVSFPVTTTNDDAQAFFNQGVALLHGAWNQEAERAFLQVQQLDPTCVMAWWGRCLANADNPSRATWFAWEAYRRRDGAAPREQAYIDAWARSYGATSEPNTVLVDAESGRRAAIPIPTTRTKRLELQRQVAAIAEAHPNDLESSALLLRQRLLTGHAGAAIWPDTRRHLDRVFARAPNHPARRYQALLSRHLPADQRPDGTTCRKTAPALAAMWHADGIVLTDLGNHPAATDAFEAASRVDHAHMARTGAVPSELPHYVPNMIARCRSLIDASRHREAVRIARELIRLPRHPRRRNGSLFFGETFLAQARANRGTRLTAVHRLPPEIAALGPATWTPGPAPAFTLDRGQGGKVTLSDYAAKGQPVVLVYYLGAGCLHCVEQLRDLAPKSRRFLKANLPIIAIGTDDLQGAKAFIQLSLESGERSHLPFPILCDPLFDSFHEYGAWSSFKNEALHGTYLIDAKGNIRWRDISIEPFMETEFLLEECTRLLKMK